MKAYKVTGSFKMGRVWQKFSKEFTGESEDIVREKTLSVIGSKHRTKRTNININSIDEMDAEEVQDLVVRDILKEE
ncbi:MAG: 50S ribosomal protein L18Ae [Thermoplasmata archaeon]